MHLHEKSRYRRRAFSLENGPHEWLHPCDLRDTSKELDKVIVHILRYWRRSRENKKAGTLTRGCYASQVRLAVDGAIVNGKVRKAQAAEALTEESLAIHEGFHPVLPNSLPMDVYSDRSILFCKNIDQLLSKWNHRQFFLWKNTLWDASNLQKHK